MFTVFALWAIGDILSSLLRTKVTMSDWHLIALIFAVSIPIGLGLGFYMRGRQKAVVERFQRVNRSISWHYYAACTILFLACAIGSKDSLPFLLMFSTFAALQLFTTVRVFVRERSQYSLRHLFITVTVAAVFFAFCHWFGMAMAVVALVIASSVGLLLLGLEWRNQKTRPKDSANSE